MYGHPFDAPAHVEQPTLPDLGKTTCTCPDSPWCTGPAGPYWLTCSRTCRSCHPRTRRRRHGERPRGEHDA